MRNWRLVAVVFFLVIGVAHFAQGNNAAGFANCLVAWAYLEINMLRKARGE